MKLYYFLPRFSFQSSILCPLEDEGKSVGDHDHGVDNAVGRHGVFLVAGVASGVRVFTLITRISVFTSYISVNSIGDSYGSPRVNVDDVVTLKEDSIPLDEIYEDNESDYAYDNYEDELPTYIIPASDTYGPAIEYASPRDFNDIDASGAVAASEDSLVIDLTSNQDKLNIDYESEVGDISPVYGQRIGASSKSHSSHNLLSQLRRHRQRWSV